MRWDRMTPHERGQWIRQHDSRYPERLQEIFQVDAATLANIFAGADYPSEGDVCMIDLTRAPGLAALLRQG